MFVCVALSHPLFLDQIMYTMEKNKLSAGTPLAAAAASDGASEVPLNTHAKHPVLYAELLNFLNASSVVWCTPDGNGILSCIRRKTTSLVLCRSGIHVQSLMSWLLDEVQKSMTEGNVLTPTSSGPNAAPGSSAAVPSPTEAAPPPTGDQGPAKKQKPDETTKKGKNQASDEEESSSSSGEESED